MRNMCATPIWLYNSTQILQATKLQLNLQTVQYRAEELAWHSLRVAHAGAAVALVGLWSWGLAGPPEPSTQLEAIMLQEGVCLSDSLHSTGLGAVKDCVPYCCSQVRLGWSSHSTVQQVH